LDRAAEGRRRVTSDDDRRMRPAVRARPGLDAVERDEPALVRGSVLRPYREHGGQVVHRPRPLVLERRAEGAELGLAVADPEPEEEAAVREDVDARQLLREHE